MNELIRLINAHLGDSIALADFSGYFLKKITLTSSISVDKVSNEYHIAITDSNGAMNFFPVVTSTKYLVNNATADKKHFYSKVPIIVRKQNLLALYGDLQARANARTYNLKSTTNEIASYLTDLALKPDLINTFTYGTLNIRTGTGQHQTEIGTSLDGQDFIKLRCSILPNEYLLFLKKKSVFAYYVYGITIDLFQNFTTFFGTHPVFFQDPHDSTPIDLTSILPLPINDNFSRNTIYYGAPGTGKSRKVISVLASIPDEQKEQVAFHPEYDNSSFVGGYKPITEKNSDGVDEIKYKFVPQVFIDIYVKAWKYPANTYVLAIEEINRGNCAEIFGDLFHLLDRKPGYSITPSNEVRVHLLNELGPENNGIKNGKMSLPNNLILLATMNTSDQSLFPMDSAFKRRWSWEYLPIIYTETDENGSPNESYSYVIKINDSISFKWIDFIKLINNEIKSNQNLGMDKCIGNYFIKSDTGEITLKEFINKVIFYLWNDVFKDEQNRVFPSNIFYEDFFPILDKGVTNLINILDNLSIPHSVVPEVSPDLVAPVSPVASAVTVDAT